MMAAGDEGGAAPTKGPGLPLWVWGAAVGVVVLFLVMKKRSGSAGTGAVASPFGGTTQVSGGGVDPNTGLPIDPFTGLPYYTSQAAQPPDLAGWIGKLEAALVGVGYAPGLVSKAAYDYANGNTLSNDEAAAINRGLTLVGFPPVTLPFFGNVPKPDPKPIVTPYTVWAFTAKAGTGANSQLTQTSGPDIVNLLRKYGLVTAAAGGKYMTTAKFGGPVRQVNVNAPLSAWIKLLQTQGIIAPLHVQTAAA